MACSYANAMIRIDSSHTHLLMRIDDDLKKLVTFSKFNPLAF